ncbi:MAG: fibronectin type III domain-containing protein [Micromonosporaceae bacterium]
MRGATKLTGLALGALAGALLPAGAGAADDGDTPQVFRYHNGGYDQAASLAVDGAGNAYIGGAVDSAGSGITFAVVKLSPSGTPLWTAHYNGSRGGVGGSALAVTVDSAGNVYAAGSIGDGSHYPNFDYLVVGFGPDGAQRWAQRHNGPGDGFDRATEIAADASGVYVSGTSYTPSPSFTFDWSTRKYSASGEPLWERRHLGNGTTADRVADLALTPDGNVVVTGITQNLDNKWATDIGTVTYDPNGAVVWQRRWTDSGGGSGEPRDMDLDAAGRITITGTVGLFPPTPVTLRYDRAGALLQQIRSDGGAAVDVTDAGDFYVAGFFREQPGSAFLTRYDASGVRSWATPLSMPDNETFLPVTVAVDSAGVVTTAGTARNVSTHNDDYLVIRYAPDGRELWRYRFHGVDERDDRVAGLAIDGAGNALVTGTSWNGYLSKYERGTADDIVTLRFAAGSAASLVAPNGLTATGISRSQIRLTWNDGAGTEDGFRIERCQGNGCADFAAVATVGHDVTTYTDGGLLPNTQYTYRVRAFNANGVSAYSNTATGKTRRR